MPQGGLGFPEFTRSFNPPFDGKLRMGMKFSMAVGADEDALV